MSSAICLLPRVLKKDNRGNDVLAMKRALSTAGYGRWKPFTKLFGSSTETLLKRFQQHHGLKIDGVYGPTTHKALAKYYDHYGMKLMNDLYHQLETQYEPVHRMVSAALAIYNYCKLTRHGTYTQSPSRMSIVKNKWRLPFKGNEWLREDCSSSCTGISWEANIPDPNDLHYNGEGYTGTMSVHGFRVRFAVLAAFGYYGPGWPYKHVVMCVATKPRPLVFSWGSGLPQILDAYYRNDFNHWRSGYAK